MKKTEVEKAKVVDRRIAGIMVLGSNGGRAALPTAYLLYEVFYSDGTIKTERGRSVRAAYTSHATGKGAEKTYRPDLINQINGTALLIHDLEQACLFADDLVDEKGSPKGPF